MCNIYSSPEKLIQIVEMKSMKFRLLKLIITLKIINNMLYSTKKSNFYELIKS